MESLFGRYKNALVLMLVLLAQVVLLAMQVRRPAPDMPDGHNVRLWRYLVTSVVTPPERLVHNIGKGGRDLWANYVNLRNLRQQNLNLQAENDRLRLEQASLAEDARQGQQLREMLDFRGRYIDRTVAAQVIGTSGTDQAKVIYIDKGSKDGLQVQMPVITPDGIVGKIKNVFPHTAQVLLISDETSGTGVLLESTRVRGVMKGNASGQPQMINISPDERIKPGEPVMTSGGDQVYPPGMPVGIVDRVVADPDTSYVNVVIKPNANLAALEAVLVVTGFSDRMPFAQQKDMMQSEVVALAEKQRASDVLAEKLPSLHDLTPEAGAKAAGGANGEAGAETATAGDGDPARPMRPPQPLHPDRYTPGAAPSAERLEPGAAPPITHRAPAVEANNPDATANPRLAGAKPAAGNPTYSGSEAPLVSRFPAKPSVAATKPPAATATASTGTGAGGASATAKPSPVAGNGTSAGNVAGTAASGATPAVSRASNMQLPLQPAQTATASSQAGQAGTGQPGSVPARRPAVYSDSDAGGILTPAGMGAIGASPRPRPVTPDATGSNGASGASSGSRAVPGGSPATGNPALRPQPKPSKPQTAPAQQTAPTAPAHSGQGAAERPAKSPVPPSGGA